MARLVVAASRRTSLQAIRIIEDEHRALAAVLHGMLYLVREIRDSGKAPDFELLSAMVYYIDAVPERLHHPKEDQYLFAALRRRYPAAIPLLDALHDEHRVGGEKVRTLEQTLTRYRGGGAGEFAAFAVAAEALADFEWNHMRREEKEVLPLALQHLTAADWKEIDAAFAGHTDPLLGAAIGDEYRHLFRKIVNLAPPPIGVGPAR
jgi:hemerythrin-like domain-containing protein